MNINEYSAAALNILRGADRPDGITAAAFGQLLVRGLPNEHWNKLGYPTLVWFLRDMEQRKLITLLQDQKGALRVHLQSAAPTTTGVERRPIKFNPLRQEVWRAFVISKPTGLRYAHRQTGAIRMGLSERPVPEDEWVEIRPISQDIQKAWAREIANTEPQNGALMTALNFDQNWYLEFSKALRATNPDLTARWNALRSERASIFVQDWCIQNKLDPEVAFAQRESSARSDKREIVADAAPDKVRKLMLSALGRMSTDELLELSIPAKYLIREINI